MRRRLGETYRSEEIDTYRKYKSIDKAVFRDDIVKSELVTIPAIVAAATDATEFFDKYNAVVSAIVDKHAPLQSGRVAVRPLVPWFSDALADAKREWSGNGDTRTSKLIATSTRQSVVA